MSENAKDNAVQQAQTWAQEARTQRATVLEILRYFGLPERDWEALSLIKAKLGDVPPAAAPAVQQSELPPAEYEHGADDKVWYSARQMHEHARAAVLQSYCAQDGSCSCAKFGDVPCERAAPAPLTDDRVDAISDGMPHQPWGIGSRRQDMRAFARAIEREVRSLLSGTRTCVQAGDSQTQEIAHLAASQASRTSEGADGVAVTPAPCAETYAGCAPDCHAGNRCAPDVALPAPKHPDCTAPDCDCEPGIECAARGAARGVAVAPDNRISVDRGALQMALNVLCRAGKNEVADALAESADAGVPPSDGGQSNASNK